MKAEYRIQKADGRIKYAGTGLDSWFTIEQARAKVDRVNGERIILSDGMHTLGEVF